MIMNNITVGMPLSQGLGLFAASLPIAFAGLVSAIHQGRAAAAGCGLVAKRPEGLGQAAMVETYAVLALLISILLIGRAV